MPITTTDVVMPAVSGVDTSKNGSAVVNCMPTGRYKSTTPAVSGIDYEATEAKLTDRFDNVTYYTIGNANILGT